MNENTMNLMRGEFNFDPKEIVDKNLLFDISLVDEEVIMDRIIDAVNDLFNDNYWIKYKPGMNYFTLRLEDGKKILKEARTIFNSLKTDLNSVLFSEEKIDQRLLKKLKKLRYLKDSHLPKLILLAHNKDFLSDDKTPTRTDYVEKREIDRSTLYSFDGPFQLLHADVGNLEFLGKSTTIPQYALVIVDVYLSKVYVYPMRSRKQIQQKMKLFYGKLKSKRKNKWWTGITNQQPEMINMT